MSRLFFCQFQQEYTLCSVLNDSDRRDQTKPKIPSKGRAEGGSGERRAGGAVAAAGGEGGCDGEPRTLAPRGCTAASKSERRLGSSPFSAAFPSPSWSHVCISVLFLAGPRFFEPLRRLRDRCVIGERTGEGHCGECGSEDDLGTMHVGSSGRWLGAADGLRTGTVAPELRGAVYSTR